MNVPISFTEQHSEIIDALPCLIDGGGLDATGILDWSVLQFPSRWRVKV